MQGKLELREWSIGPIPVEPTDDPVLLVEFKAFPVEGELWGFTSRRDPDTDGLGSGMALVLEFRTLPTGFHILRVQSIVDGTEMVFVLEVDQ